MKIYTKTGDAGTTGLLGSERASKSDPRFDAIGDVDEVNAALGWALVACGDGVKAVFLEVQSRLFEIGAELAAKEKDDRFATLRAEDVAALESAIDAWTEVCPELTSFILPGGSEGAARLHLARTVCRRAERSVVSLAAKRTIRSEILVYLNRLSDALFAAARFENQRHAVADLPWHGRPQP